MKRLAGLLLGLLLLAPATAQAQVLAYPSGVAGLSVNNCATAQRLLYLSSTNVTGCSTLSYDGTNVTLASGLLITTPVLGQITIRTSGRTDDTGIGGTTGTTAGATQIFSYGTARFSVDGTNVAIAGTQPFGWVAAALPTTDALTVLDLSLGRAGAANLRLGAAAANPPVAQTLSTQGASGTDVAGANFTVDVSPGTGTGAGGSYIIRTAAAGGTGSSQNAQAAALTIASTGAVTASRATGGIGYGTGAGGTVTQQTSKATGATLSTVTGTVVMNNAALAADTTVSFVLTNTTIAADDHILLNHKKTGTIGAYTFHAEPAAGSVTIYVRNVTAGSLSEAIEIQFAVFKAVTS